MKKIWNQILVGICALLLVGCALEDAEQTQIKSETETDPLQFAETVNERLTIDAPVYPFADTPKVYHATSEFFTQEQIEAFVTACGDSLTSLEDVSTEYYVVNSGTTAKDGEIWLIKSASGLFPSQFYYEKNDNWWQHYTVYPRQQY